MEIFVDGKEFQGELGGATLQDMLGDLADRALGQDATMREIKINGQPFEEARLGPADRLGRENVQRLEVETIPAREMALHFLTNADAYLATIAQAVPQVAELFRVGDEQEASERYLSLLEGLGLFLQMLQASRDVLELDFSREVAQGRSAEEMLEQLSTKVQELLNAQESQDWVLLADVLEYDLAGELAHWQGFLPTLKGQALS